MTEQEIIDALKVPGGSITLGVTESAPVKKKPVKMPELKSKDTGDKMEVEIKSEKIKGYENAKPMKKGGAVKKMAKGGSVGSASKRADGCATKGKTKGRII
jgi:hypothetical protein